MKRWKKIAISILLVLLAIIVSLAVWQKENLKAVYTFLTNDSETISKDLEDKQREQQESLEKDYNITVQAPSIDQSNDLLDGKVSPDEVKDSLGISQVTQPPPEQEKPNSNQPKPSQPPPEEQPEVELPPTPELTEAERQTQIENLINQCVAELYACEVDLMALLGQMKQGAVDEWRALKPEERTQEKKMEIGLAGLDKCYTMEVEIDDQVDEILERYRGPLEELEADTSVLEDLWRSYCDKKASQKAYYLDKYLD